MAAPFQAKDPAKGALTDHIVEFLASDSKGLHPVEEN